MAFRSGKQPQKPDAGAGNRFGQSVQANLDRGAKINELARQLRSMAASKLEGSDAIAALQTALGPRSRLQLHGKIQTPDRIPLDTSWIRCSTWCRQAFVRPLTRR